MFKKTIGAILFCALLITTIVQAQDQRRARPAFPIGAGEKMLVIGGQIFDKTITASPTYKLTTTSNWLVHFPIQLPVGTTIKRVLGDFVDQSGSANFTMELYRINNADMSSKVVLRAFNSSGISSSSATDFKQIVANPLSHSILQGWTYYLSVQFPGGTSSDEMAIGVIKIIYEP